MVSLELQPEFGYVLLVLVSTVFLHLWLMLNVGGARKKYKVFYPTLYSDKVPEFNCYQRAHQNTLEQIPFFLATLPVAGLRHPCAAAAIGAAWIVGRVVYAVGYYSGDPKKRMPGVFLSFGAQLGLIVAAVSTAAKFVGWW